MIGYVYTSSNRKLREQLLVNGIGENPSQILRLIHCSEHKVKFQWVVIVEKEVTRLLGRLQGESTIAFVFNYINAPAMRNGVNGAWPPMKSDSVLFVSVVAQTVKVM